MDKEQKRKIGNILFHEHSWSQKDIDDLDMKLEDIIDAYEQTEQLSIPAVSKRLVKVRFRYLNRTDDSIHSDTFEAETPEEALQMLYDKYGYDIEWRTIGDA